MRHCYTPFTLSIIAFLLIFPAFKGNGGRLAAELVTLKTGQTIRGEILMQNDAVLIIRDRNGAKFQYLKNDILSIESEETEEPDIEFVTTQTNAPKNKKVFMSVELAGGGFSSPHNYNGGSFSADLLIGSHHIGDTRIFVGGGLGYHGYYGSRLYSFLPLMVALRAPVIEGVHAPQFGAAIGYGFSLTSNATHGLYAGVDVGYRYQKTKKSALYAGLFASFQQTSLTVTENITDTSTGTVSAYTYVTGANLIAYGAKFTVYF